MPDRAVGNCPATLASKAVVLPQAAIQRSTLCVDVNGVERLAGGHEQAGCALGPRSRRCRTLQGAGCAVKSIWLAQQMTRMCSSAICMGRLALLIAWRKLPIICVIDSRAKGHSLTGASPEEFPGCRRQVFFAKCRRWDGEEPTVAERRPTSLGCTRLRSVIADAGSSPRHWSEGPWTCRREPASNRRGRFLGLSTGLAGGPSMAAEITVGKRRQRGEAIPCCDRRCPAECRQGRCAHFGGSQQSARTPRHDQQLQRRNEAIAGAWKKSRVTPEGPAQGRDHLGDRERLGIGHDQRPPQWRIGAQHSIDGRHQILDRK